MKIANTPNYILFLFAVIFCFLCYIIATWGWNKLYRKSQSEGFQNPQYTYLPDTKSPNLSIQFGLSDLAIDVSSVCDFIKIDSQLSNNSVATVTTSPQPLITTTPLATTPLATTPPLATTTPMQIQTGTTPPFWRQSPTPKPTKTTQPAKTTPSPTTPKVNTFGDYTVTPTSLQIYSMYNNATGYSSTSNANIYAKMDISYGSFFDSSKISSMQDSDIAKLWNANQSIAIDDALYNGVNYFVMQSGSNAPQCKPGLSSYFLQLIQQNKHNSATLVSLKNAYYTIIKPRFLMNTLSNVYWQNVISFTNSDKGTNNTVLFVINTFASTVNSNTISTDLSDNNVANIISSSSAKTPFTTDSIWCYQSISIAFELYRFILYFQTNGKNTSGTGKPAITTTFDSIMGGYNQYLQKVNQVAPTSPLLFLLQNMPNDQNCPLTSTLQKYINTTNY